MTNNELLERISDLEKELLETKNRMLYEINKYEKLLEGKEAGIVDEVCNIIKLEIEAIDEIADHVDERNRTRLKRRVDRIKQQLYRYKHKIK